MAKALGSKLLANAQRRMERVVLGITLMLGKTEQRSKGKHKVEYVLMIHEKK